MLTTKQLIELAKRGRPMTAEELRAQRRSFVYGNLNIENDRVTREVVDEADRKISPVE